MNHEWWDIHKQPAGRIHKEKGRVTVSARKWQNMRAPDGFSGYFLVTSKVRPFSVCSSDTLLACALASVGQFLRLWFFKEGFSV
jgi:hypothetical protein